MDNSRTLSKGRGVNHILTHKSIIPKYPLELNEEHSMERDHGGFMDNFGSDCNFNKYFIIY